MLHLCSSSCRHDPAVVRSRQGNNDLLTVDFHCHILTPDVESIVAGTPQKKAEPGLQLRLQGEPSFVHNEVVVFPEANRRLSSVAERIADMDRMGVDIQVMSPSGVQYYYWADEDIARKIVRMQNENVAENCALYPDRLRGLGTVALQHPRLAVEQLRHCVRELGLQGIVVSSIVNGEDLSSPALEPLWREAYDLECVVFIHPLGSSLGERLNTHYLCNIIGQPIETTIALSKLILDGVLDRHPGFKIVAAHGGGYLPSYIGRSEHGYAVRPGAGGPKCAPREYLKKIWFDTVVFDPLVVRHLIETVGASQIVLGTDYPYDMGAYDVHEFINSVPGITLDERRQILGGNAAFLFGLDAQSLLSRIT